jgi:hypothetical protein
VAPSQDLVHKHVDVRDSPFENLLMHVNECNMFISAGMDAGGVLVIRYVASCHELLLCELN